MIYVNDEKLAKLDEEKLAILKQEFPTFFRDSGSKPIEIRFDERFARIVEWGNPSSPNKIIRKKAYPNARGIKTICVAPDSNGVSSTVVYTETPIIKNKNGEVKYSNTSINLSHGLTFHYKRDLEKLYYLYFYSGRILGTPSSMPDAEFYFVKSDVDAQQFIDRERKMYALKDEILFGGVTYATIGSCLSAFGRVSNGTEEEDRVLVFDLVSKNPTLLEQYVRIKEAGEMGSKIDEYMTVIRLAIDSGKLSDSNGSWKHVGKTGEGRPFAEVSAKDAIGSLARWLLNDEVNYRKLEKAISEE